MKTQLPQSQTRRFALLTIAVLLGTALPAQADLLIYEGFDIPPGEIHGHTGATSFGWRLAGATQMNWSAIEGVIPDATLYHGVAQPGLTWPGLASTGNAFGFRNEATQGSSVTQRMIPGFLAYGLTGKRWMSALLTPQIAGDTAGGGWFQLCLSGAPQLHGSIYLGVANTATRDQTVWSAGGERLYIIDGPNERDKWSVSAVPLEDGVGVFLVILLDFDTKTAAWWINPPVGAENPGEPVARFDILTDLYVERVMLRVFNNGPSQLKEVPDFAGQGLGADYTGTRVDEIRIGTTYASVAPAGAAPDPVAPVLQMQVLDGAGQISYVRAAGDTSWAPSVSGNLTEWQSPAAFGVSVTEQVVDNGDGTETVTLSLDNIHQRVFLRLGQQP